MWGPLLICAVIGVLFAIIGPYVFKPEPYKETRDEAEQSVIWYFEEEYPSEDLEYLKYYFDYGEDADPSEHEEAISNVLDWLGKVEAAVYNLEDYIKD